MNAPPFACWSLSLVVVTAAWLGCASEIEQDFIAPLPADRTVGTLTSSDRASFCSVAREHFRETLGGEAALRDRNCTLVAALTTTTRDACEAAASQWRASRTPYDRGFCPFARAPQPGATCDVTVADVELCITESTAAWEHLLGAVTCDDAGMVPEAHDGDPIPSCTALEARCPSHFEL